MKKIKQIKRIAAVVMAVSVAVGLTACQQKTDSQGNSTQTGTLQKVLKERKMTVGCILSFPPSATNRRMVLPWVMTWI